MTEGWTFDLESKLCELWNKGKSAGEIAQYPEFHWTTRGAIAGKASRLRKARDPRIKIGALGPKPGPEFTDDESLFILDRHENKKETFPKIARRLRRSHQAVAEHYHSIIRELEESERA